MFSLTGYRPASTAAYTPSIASFNKSRPVILSYFSLLSVSRLIFTLIRPASLSSYAYFLSNVPLVVRDTSLSIIGEALLIISTISFLTRGSPPVNFTFLISSSRAILRILSISSEVISLVCLCHSPSLWQ